MNMYQLLGSEVSYYTGKVRAYLRFKGIDFEEVNASKKVFKEIILPKTGVAFIPVLITPENQAIQDTTEIIDFLETRFPEASVYPEAPLQRLTALLFELYGDEWLKIPAMYYRWWFKEENYEFIISEFGKGAVPDVSAAEQRQTGEKIAGYFGGSLPVLGITEKNHQQIESWYEDFLDLFSRHLEQTDFLLGSRPSIGDFGLMGPLYAHLYRDPYPGKLMKQRAPLVALWVERMNDPQPPTGDFLPDDRVPETLFPILKMIFKEHFPVLQGTVTEVGKWVKENPGQELPRAVGQHQFTIGGVSESRLIFPFDQWMLQRPLDHYNSLPTPVKETTDQWLKTLGGYEGMQTSLPASLKRVNNRLVVDQ